jgi:hypothetical protein
MDEFEQMMKDMKGMSRKDMNMAKEKLTGMCPCPKCPTSMHVQRIQKRFMSISEEKGCIGPACLVTSECG